MRAQQFDSYALVEYGTSGEFTYFSISGQFPVNLRSIFDDHLKIIIFKPLEFQQLSIEQIGIAGEA